MTDLSKFISCSFVFCLFVLGCNKDVSGPGEFELAQEKAPVISPEELARARVACEDYKGRVCLAASNNDKLSKDCRQADMRLEAVNTQTKLLNASNNLNLESSAVVRA